jgi:DNA-binding NtrC family response regulator
MTDKPGTKSSFAPEQQKHTILIVDDDLDLLEYVAECLEPVGGQVMRASNGKEALEICMREKVDLIISDISMPEVDGLEFVGMLRDRNDFTPVIMLSGHEDHEKVRKAWKLGAFSYVEKLVAGTQIAKQAAAALESGREFTAEKYLAGSAMHHTVSISLDKQFYRDTLAHCLDAGISMQTLVDRLLQEHMRRVGSKKTA